MKNLKVRAFALAFLFLVTTSAARAAESWQSLAKKVGESEENRDKVIASLRKIPSIKAKLAKAIYSKDRPLALDVISALGLKEMVPDLLLVVPADPDGFLTVALNSMMTSENQALILKSYQENLLNLKSMSSGAVVAMLEPLGRMSVILPRPVLTTLRDAKSPEVRAAVVYYLRIMALRGKHFENLDMLASLLKAPEFQVRMQVVSVSMEIGAKKGVPSLTDLKTSCAHEKVGSVRAACFAFIGVSSRVPASAAQCSALEDSLYAHNTVKMRMVFGYKDARPARFVGDRHERLAFIEKVTAPCGLKSDDVCGFARSKDNADLFLKKSKVRGHEKRFLLWAVNSSVGTDDEENLRDPFQMWKSKYAEDAFTSGLREADVVLYDGHSRFGGGPDFRSPKLAADGTIDPKSYQSQKPGLLKMVAALQKTPPRAKSKFGHLKVLGMFSCSSEQHFNEEIRRVSPAGIVSSKVLMYYSDALAQSYGTLSDVIKGRCPRGISF